MADSILDSGSVAYVSVSILLFVSLWVGFFFLLNSQKEEVQKRREEIAQATA